MSDVRIPAADLTILINEAVKQHLNSADPITYGEILFALRVCAAAIINDLPEHKRAQYIQSHMIGTAEMLGVPLIAQEIDMPDKESMN
jgi:undecaprenyl pyrophosphate phosphatase UppP